MLSLLIAPDIPFGAELFLLRPAAAAAVQASARRGIHREAEQVLRLGEIGHETALEQKVCEAEEVREENKSEDGVEDPLPLLGPAGGVVLRLDRRLEPLVLRHGERGNRGGVIPEMDKRRVSGTGQQRRAGQNRQRLRDRGQGRVQAAAGGNQLAEKTRVRRFPVADPGVQAQGNRPTDGDVDPIAAQHPIGCVRIASAISQIIRRIFTP